MSRYSATIISNNGKATLHTDGYGALEQCLTRIKTLDIRVEDDVKLYRTESGTITCIGHKPSGTLTYDYNTNGLPPEKPVLPSSKRFHVDVTAVITRATYSGVESSVESVTVRFGVPLADIVWRRTFDLGQGLAWCRETLGIEPEIVE